MASKETKTAKTVAEVKTVAKAPVAEPKKEAATETKTAAVKKAPVAKKAPAKKAPAKKAEIKTNVLLQFAGKEVAEKDIVANVKKAWTSQFKGKVKDIKTMDIYVKPDENKAYFVINGVSEDGYFIEL